MTVNLLSRLRRSSAVVAALATAVSVALAAGTSVGTAAATPVRTATLTSYNTATFLQDDLGLTYQGTSPVIQPVTYDEFQWLLQQSGNYAFLIGDPATDANFPAEAQEVETTAEADGVQTVFWFDPNLSGGGILSSAAHATEVGTTFEPNLDIRDPSALSEVTSTTSSPTNTYALTETSQNIYGNAWFNLIAQYLGDGASEYLSGVDTESAQVFGVALGSATATYNSDTIGNGTSYISNPAASGNPVQAVTTVGNDAGATSIGGASTEITDGAVDPTGGAMYDYTGDDWSNVDSSGTWSNDSSTTAFAPTTAQDQSYFFTYNKANTETVSSSQEPEKITSWVNLDAELSTYNIGEVGTDVNLALTTGAANTAGGASGFSSPTQFDWWESEATGKNNIVDGSTSTALASGPDADGGDIPLLTSANDQASDGGWKLDQITYPELVDLLKNGGASNAVILFGGTWCPNTRPVVPFINEYAQDNNATVFNFDTVLDGGTTGGGTTSASNPIQSRNTVNAVTTVNGGVATTQSSNASFLYGDLVSAYLANINTEYSPTVDNTAVTYYPGGNATKTLSTAAKLQVPFLIGYQKGASPNSDTGGKGGVTRQWIDEQTDASGLPFYTEYMSDWDYTNPQPYELGIGTTGATGIPSDAAIWSTLNSEVPTFTAQTTAASVDPNTATDADDANYLGSADYAQLKITLSSGTATAVASPTADVSSGATGSTTSTLATTAAISVSPSSLSAALSALGASAPANYTAAKAALIPAYNASPTSTLTSELETVDAAWGVAQARKTTVINRLGNANEPGSLIGGATAVQALNTFFGGLPGGVVSTQTLTANSVSYGTKPQITVGITNQYERVAQSNLALSVDDNGTQVVTGTSPVTNGVASYTLPVLLPGTYNYTVTYPGDSSLLPFSDSGTFTVSQDPAQIGASTAVANAPTAKAAGTYTITVNTPSGLAAATGSVTVTFKDGSVTKTVTGTLSNGTVTVATPRLTPGTWTTTVAWSGNATYPAASWTGASITVAKIGANKVLGSVTKAPTSKKAGKYKVTIDGPSGLTKATGKVTLKFAKGKTTKTVTGNLKGGDVTVSVPKLAKGSWKVTISWPGDSNYLSAKKSEKAIRVKK